jgi:hypothetical protein
VDPLKLVPAAYFPYIISVLFTALTGLAGWLVRKFFKITDTATRAKTRLAFQARWHSKAAT